MRKISFLDTPMHVSTMSETVNTIGQRIESREFTQHAVVNVAKLVNMKKDVKLKESVESCDILNIDGMGIVFGARFLGHDIPERVAGIDLFHELIAMSTQHGFPVYLLGSQAHIVTKVCHTIQHAHPDLLIAGSHHGYFWEDEQSVVDQIKQSGARLLFVAITSPKKETFINRWKDELGVDFVMGVGGTFDVIAGKVKRAPIWMQKAGLEWLYRIIQEPRRMWKRYLVTNSQFLLLLLRSKFSKS